MRKIDLMADLDLDNGDTKSDGFEFQPYYYFLKATAYGMGVGFWTLVAPHPHVTFRGSPTSPRSFILPFTSFLSLTCPLLFLRIIMEVKLTARLINELF